MTPADHDVLIEIATTVRAMHRTLEGNGQPGVTQRLSSLERWRSRVTGGFKIVAWTIGILATAVGGAVAAILRHG